MLNPALPGFVFSGSFIEIIPDFSMRTKLVTASASGGGDGSEGDPWTLAEAMTNAVAGDIVGIQNGTYVGVSGSQTVPAFNPSNEGTSGNPIVFVGQSESGVDIRSGATVQASGWPAFGSNSSDHIWWISVHSDNNDANNKTATDSGTTVFRNGANYCKILKCTLTGQSGQSDNYAAYQIEDCHDIEIADCTVSGYVGNVNNSSMILYRSYNIDYHHNNISNCQHGIQPKGDLYSLFFHHNLIDNCNEGFRFHGPNLGPGGEISLIYQNIVTNCTNFIEGTSSGSTTGEQEGLYVFNNSTYLVDYFLKLSQATDAGNIPRDNNFFNNIFYDGSAYLRSDILGVIDNWVDYGDYDRNVIFSATAFGSGGTEVSGYDLATWQSTDGKDMNSTTGDPNYTDAANGDFSLGGSSSATDLGRDLLNTFGGGVNSTVDAGVYPSGVETIGVRS